MVLTRSSPHLQRLHRKHYAGVGGWRGMELVHVNASGRLVSFACYIGELEADIFCDEGKRLESND